MHMHGFVKRWGGSLVIRIDPNDARQLGLEEGTEVEVDIHLPPIDFHTMPTVKGSGSDAERHDELLHARD